MNPFVIDLKDVLVILANKLLPAKSGFYKILEVFIKMTQGEDKTKFVKIIFWHPNNYMMVAYTFESELSDFEDNDNFIITSNHDSTWKYDGFNFFNKVMEIPDNVYIISVKEIQIEDMIINEREQICFLSVNN